MRARNEARRAIVRTKIIHHQNETEERPVGRFALDVHVQILRRHVRPHRARMERAQLAWSSDNGSARLEQRWKGPEVAEFGTPIHEVINASRRAADFYRVAHRRSGGFVHARQPFQSIWRERPTQYDKAPLLELRRGTPREPKRLSQSYAPANSDRSRRQAAHPQLISAIGRRPPRGCITYSMISVQTENFIDTSG